MKKLKYEKPEVEIELLDPELDIITVSGDGDNSGGDGGYGKILEKDLFNETN